MERREIQDELGLYESLSVISEKMLKVAEDEAWEDVIALEQQHRKVYACLREVNGHQYLAKKSLDHKTKLINRILKMDRQTQTLIKQRMEKLQKGGAEERKIMQAYGAQVV